MRYRASMQNIKFIKMHGLGNDFVVIDKRSNKIKITEKIIKKLSDRRSGAGCDQLITINSAPNNIDAAIEIFNPSGDRAEACGNGTRCVAKILFDEKNNKDSLNILSDSGILKAKKKDNINISVNMGRISNNWKSIPLNQEMDTLNIPIIIQGFSKGVGVSVGNPHIVFFGDSINNIDIKEFGPKIENHEFFPNKTNVEFVEIINSQKIKMKVWERGVGVTLACGSGACASVYAGLKKKLLDKDVEVQVEKGSLFIEILDEEAIMTGPAEISYFGNINL